MPELARVPTEHIHEPWLMSKTEQEQYNCRIDIDYPAPIVDEKAARKEGISKSYKAKGDAGVRRRAKIVFDIHGSRSRQSGRSRN